MVSMAIGPLLMKSWCKRNRWMMKISGVCGEGAGVLPPKSGAKPSLTWKEMEIRHVSEVIYYPMRPEWRPVQLVLYTFGGGTNGVFSWIKECYNPQSGSFKPVASGNFLKTATLQMLDGCGSPLETYTFEECWPQVAEFGTVDMGSAEIATCDLTLRYNRAYM